MGKAFFEVFPGLKLDSKTSEIMEQTNVTKVSTTRKQDFIRILRATISSTSQTSEGQRMA